MQVLKFLFMALETAHQRLNVISEKSTVFSGKGIVFQPIRNRSEKALFSRFSLVEIESILIPSTKKRNKRE